MSILPRMFYAQDTVTVARNLLGKQLVRRMEDVTISGTIIETEAYKHLQDPASHAYGGMTPRNCAMFGRVGLAYVYFTYGMHYCVNAVARDDDSEAGAVLIRAIRPEKGIKHMIKNRKKTVNLADGPAKLAQALHIDKKQYGTDLTKRSTLYITHGKESQYRIKASARIGITKAASKKWNFRI